jgi:hypothetical protein
MHRRKQPMDGCGELFEKIFSLAFKTLICFHLSVYIPSKSLSLAGSKLWRFLLLKKRIGG